MAVSFRRQEESALVQTTVASRADSSCRRNDGNRRLSLTPELVELELRYLVLLDIDLDRPRADLEVIGPQRQTDYLASLDLGHGLVL